MRTRATLGRYTIAVLLALLDACGGGGGGSTSGSGTVDVVPASYTISGTLSGLAVNSSVSLQDNGKDTVTISTNGSFSFPIAIATGSSYLVTVSGQPTGQTCYVAIGSNSGTIANANISGVTITCQAIGPEINIGWDNQLVAPGQNATLQWVGTDVSNCSASGNWSGSQATSGSIVVSSGTPGYYSYYLSCTTSSGILTESAVLTVYGTTNITRASATSQPIWYGAALSIAPPNQIVEFDSDMVVPAVPPTPGNSNAYFAIWPGLEPAQNQTNYNPINLGVLQPVLEDYLYTSWDAIAVYDNDNGVIPPIISGVQSSAYPQEVDGTNSNNSNNEFVVQTGDIIHTSMLMNMSSGFWTVIITDVTQNVTNTVVMNMQGQQQNYALFDLESWYGMTVGVPISFTNNIIIFSDQDTTGACSTTTGALNNYVMTPPILDGTGTVCRIAQVTVVQN